MVAGSRHHALYARDRALRKNNPGYGPERFTSLPQSKRYLSPAGEQLNYLGLSVRNRRCETLAEPAKRAMSGLSLVCWI
jgi:hypothetical protein